MLSKLDMNLNILNIIAKERDTVKDKYVKCVAEHAAMISAANTWDDCHSDDGVGSFSANPFNNKISPAEKNMNNCKRRYDELVEIYRHAVVTFITEVTS